jgi:ABC-type transport system substrate-binding protein
MRARTTIAAIAAVVLTMAMTGCGGAPGGAASGGSSGTVKKGGILRIGTTSYIDSLNPFIGIETQSTPTSKVPAARPVRARARSRATGQAVGDVLRRQDLDVPPGAEREVVDGQPMTADDVAWTGNTIIRVCEHRDRGLARRSRTSRASRHPTRTLS